MSSYGWLRYPILFASVVLGFALALYYWQLNPSEKQRFTGLEHGLDSGAAWIIKHFTEKSVQDNSIWGAFENLLPPEVLRNRQAYQLEILSTPFAVQPDASLHWLVSDFCSKLPEWGGVYVPSQLTISDGYYAFLTSLEPILPQIASSLDQKRLRQLADKLNDNAHATNSLAVRQITQAVDNKAASDEINAILGKYRNSAKNKGLRSAGAADYFTDFWNAGYEEERPGNVTTVVKRCEAEGLEQWIASGAGRPVIIKGGVQPGSSSKSTGSQADQTWEYVDLGESRLFALKQTKNGGGTGPDLVTMQARRLKIFWLKRPGWFSSEAIRLFGKTGPWASDRPVKNPARDLWGTHGVLRLLPTALLVVDSPSASIEMSQDDFSRLSQWSGSSSDQPATAIPSISLRQQGAKLGLELRGASHELNLLPNQQLAYVVAVLSVKMPLTSSYD